MKTDFTVGELWQIEDALDYYLRHCFGDTINPEAELYVKFLRELRQKVGDIINQVR